MPASLFSNDTALSKGSERIEQTKKCSKEHCLLKPLLLNHSAQIVKLNVSSHRRFTNSSVQPHCSVQTKWYSETATCPVMPIRWLQSCVKENIWLEPLPNTENPFLKKLLHSTTLTKSLGAKQNKAHFRNGADAFYGNYFQFIFVLWASSDMCVNTTKL